MVIAKCLRSRRQGSMAKPASAGTTITQPIFLVAMKLKFDNLRGFFGRRDKLPLFHGVLASLNEQGVSADDPRAFHMSVRSDDYFDFDLAGNIHPLSKFRISGCRL